jgi:hypothetical protein
VEAKFTTETQSSQREEHQEGIGKFLRDLCVFAVNFPLSEYDTVVAPSKKIVYHVTSFGCGYALCTTKAKFYG